jgi:hypothetical protein
MRPRSAMSQRCRPSPADGTYLHSNELADTNYQSMSARKAAPPIRQDDSDDDDDAQAGDATVGVVAPAVATRVANTASILRLAAHAMAYLLLLNLIDWVFRPLTGLSAMGLVLWLTTGAIGCVFLWNGAKALVRPAQFGLKELGLVPYQGRPLGLAVLRGEFAAHFLFNGSTVVCAAVFQNSSLLWFPLCLQGAALVGHQITVWQAAPDPVLKQFVLIEATVCAFLGLIIFLKL